jgi:membrane-bound lytic murein transglycosylase F
VKHLTTLLLGLFVTFCAERPSVLEEIRERGELRMITYINPTTYYEGAAGPGGLEYDLARQFAAELGVRLRLVLVPGARLALPALQAGEGDLAAAGLVVTDERKRTFRFGPSYQNVTHQIVYRNGARKPRGVADLVGRSLEVVAGGPHARHLEALKASHPRLTWRENEALSSEDLLERVREGAIDHTVADSDEISLTRSFYPELRVAFDLGPQQVLAWAFPRHTDDSLYLAAIRFFNHLRKTGDLAHLLERYYGHVSRLDYVGTRKLLLHTAERLPALFPLFRASAEELGLDWRLLAAIAYQESQWNPRAANPSGASGLMMLTGATARSLGVKDPFDPRESIPGGARYFVMVRDRLHAAVTEPDRTWLALASYNVGYAHLEDARKLTRKLGGNPDRWVDVKRHLPLLAEERWHTQTRHGFARGGQPVYFVENVRRYYDLLTWYDKRQRAPAAPAAEASPAVPDWELDIPLM